MLPPHPLLRVPRHQLSYAPLLLAFGAGLVVCPLHETTDGAHGSPCALKQPVFFFSSQPDGAHHTHDCSRAALIVSLSQEKAALKELLKIVKDQCEGGSVAVIVLNRRVSNPEKMQA